MRIFRIMTLAIAFLTIGCAQAQDLKDILGRLSKRDSASTSSTASKVGGILGAINKLTGNDKLDYADLVGSWIYESPAVSFKSDNLMKNAGGIAASKAVESKIEPYFQKAGITQLNVTFAEDSTFVMQVKRVKLQGTVEKKGEEDFVFHFKAVGKVNVGQMTAYITEEEPGKISLTFDASRLISLVDKIAQISGNSSMKAASSLLNGYEGMTVGFALKKK